MHQQLPDWSTDLAPQLSVDRPHLWQVSLSIATISENKFPEQIPKQISEQIQEQIQKLRATLSTDEQARADQFYDPLDGQRYIIARGTLRSILSQYLHLDPSEIKFTYTPQGKPILDRAFLTGDQQVLSIQFNLSHSQDLAVYGVMLDRPLGIDVEYLRPLKEALSLAKRWFTPKEYTEICQSPDPTKTFFRFWTAKEAYLKATGAGLRHLSQVEIVTKDNDSLQLREFPNSADILQADSLEKLQDEKLQNLDNPEINNPVNWSIVELTPAPGYVGALAIPRDLAMPKNLEIPEFRGIS